MTELFPGDPDYWENRALDAEAQVARLRDGLSKARATMDAAAHIVRGLEDDPGAVGLALSKLDHGREEARMTLRLTADLTDPTGQRVEEEWRARQRVIDAAKKFDVDMDILAQYPGHREHDTELHYAVHALAAVEQARSSK